MGWRDIVTRTFAPHMPQWLWLRYAAMIGTPLDPFQVTAITKDAFKKARGGSPTERRKHDTVFRHWSDGYELRRWSLGRLDGGNMSKAMLAGWGLDVRDPTSDLRMVEYCLSVPTREFIASGIPRSLARRAMADRLPASVTGERRAGYQAADWHESLTPPRAARNSTVWPIAARRAKLSTSNA